MIGEGGYGNVYLATDLKTSKDVAIKKIGIGPIEKGVCVSAIREIQILQELSHPNIISILDIYQHNQNINLVIDYCEYDLNKLLKDEEIIVTNENIKSLMYQLLKALEYLNLNNIIHRDIKPHNLLIKKDVLKVADFGLSRYFEAISKLDNENPKYSSQVITIWYRPPELLLGLTHYDSSVDIWGTGCIFAEMLGGEALFQGNSELAQLVKIFAITGTPTEENWPSFQDLPINKGESHIKFPPQEPKPLKSLFSNASEEALDLLSQMLQLDPKRRISAKEALEHPYFQNN
ncbi:cyclin-dependent kinase 12 [Anaeramoeba flamelloides]|uniref:Cyclin-dependent kinase 12 n=1 Tax=Anaeramoeba flamelloides TaxID=1746091 RepID=A0ABQ8X511_9EUKA|nr:cyclin-dependent kinase 12 [Anaeramoeba flamelloides]